MSLFMKSPSISSEGTALQREVDTFSGITGSISAMASGAGAPANCAICERKPMSILPEIS